METKDWLMLKIISEEKNITKAAERLYISQPSLSYRIKCLEKELGVTLFLRGATGVVLTAQGEILINFAKKMLYEYTQLKDNLQASAREVQGRLRIGTSSVFAHYKLPHLLQSFAAKYSNVDINVRTGLSSQIHRLLQKDEISVAIVRGDYSWPEEQFKLSEEAICITALSEISMTTLPDLPRIIYRTDPVLQALMERWWSETYSHPPKVSMEVDSMDTCRQMVIKGLGWAILPQIGLSSADNLNTIPLYWKNGHPFTRQTIVQYRTISLELPVVRAFIAHLQEY